MSTALAKLIEFTQILSNTGMGHAAVVARAYDFALALCRSQEEVREPAGAEMPATLQIQMMDHAADLLNVALGGFKAKEDMVAKLPDMLRVVAIEHQGETIHVELHISLTPEERRALVQATLDELARQTRSAGVAWAKGQKQ